MDLQGFSVPVAYFGHLHHRVSLRHSLFSLSLLLEAMLTFYVYMLTFSL
jgi:hypothetical protein